MWLWVSSRFSERTARCVCTSQTYNVIAQSAIVQSFAATAADGRLLVIAPRLLALSSRTLSSSTITATGSRRSGTSFYSSSAVGQTGTSAPSPSKSRGRPINRVPPKEELPMIVTAAGMVKLCGRPENQGCPLVGLDISPSK